MNVSGLLEPQVNHGMVLIDSLYMNGIAADLSETGCGKTHVAACIARAMNCPVIVVCPKMVMPDWEATLAAYGIKATVLINYEKLCRGNTKFLKYRKPTDNSGHVYSTNRNKAVEKFLTAYIKFPPGSLVVLDESHKCKGMTSLNAGLMIALKRQGYRCLLLSATQATNPLEMKAFGNVANLHKLSDFKDFCIDYGAQWVGKWGAQYFDSDDKEAQAKMKQCHANLFDGQKISSRLTKEQMGDLFPENHIIVKAYQMDAAGKIQSRYDWMENEIARLQEKTENYAQHILAIIIKARREIELLKVPTILEMIEDLYDEGKSVAVFVNFTDTIELIVRRLKKNKKFKDTIGLIYGGQSVKDRIQDVADFNADKKRIIVANIAAGGQSINLHDLTGKHPRATIINPNYSAIQLLQTLGRIHRQGGLTKCYQRILFAAQTREEHICKRLNSKITNLSILNDGDMVEGMKFFRFLMGRSI